MDHWLKLMLLIYQQIMYEFHVDAHTIILLYLLQKLSWLESALLKLLYLRLVGRGIFFLLKMTSGGVAKVFKHTQKLSSWPWPNSSEYNSFSNFIVTFIKFLYNYSCILSHCRWRQKVPFFTKWHVAF